MEIDVIYYLVLSTVMINVYRNVRNIQTDDVSDLKG